MLLGVVLFAGLAGAPAAQAHDELTGSTPAEGDVLAEAPARVELTFSNNPAAIGSEVRVTGPDGADWADGDVEVLNNVATQRLRPNMPGGEYAVQWRVVSSDAHPIEGDFGFTVGAGATPAPGDGTGGDGGADEGTADDGVADDGVADDGVADDAAAEEAAGAGAGVWILVVVGVAVAAGLVAVALLVRSRVRGPGGS